MFCLAEIFLLILFQLELSTYCKQISPKSSQASGRYHVLWNGKDDRNNPVSSGVYLYRLTAGTYSHSRKMILMQ